MSESQPPSNLKWDLQSLFALVVSDFIFIRSHLPSVLLIPPTEIKKAASPESRMKTPTMMMMTTLAMMTMTMMWRNLAGWNEMMLIGLVLITIMTMTMINLK